MKFVKAKEPLVSTPLIENVKAKKKANVVIQKVLTKSPNPIVAKPKAKGKSLPRHKEVLKLNTIAIIVESNGTLGQIATSSKH